MSDFLCKYCGLIFKNHLEGQMHEDGHNRPMLSNNDDDDPVMIYNCYQ